MDNLAHDAEKLHNAMKLYCGTNPSPEVKKLIELTRSLYDEFRAIHNPRELERIATLIKEKLYHVEPGAMMTNHCNELKSGYEHLRLNLRKFE